VHPPKYMNFLLELNSSSIDQLNKYHTTAKIFNKY
jgi:hypothetical protein